MSFPQPAADCGREVLASVHLERAKSRDLSDDRCDLSHAFPSACASAGASVMSAARSFPQCTMSWRRPRARDGHTDGRGNRRYQGACVMPRFATVGRELAKLLSLTSLDTRTAETLPLSRAQKEQKSQQYTAEEELSAAPGCISVCSGDPGSCASSAASRARRPPRSLERDLSERAIFLQTRSYKKHSTSH